MEQIIQENGITFTALRSATLDRHDPNEDLMVLEGVPDMQIKKAKFSKQRLDESNKNTSQMSFQEFMKTKKNNGEITEYECYK